MKRAIQTSARILPQEDLVLLVRRMWDDAELVQNLPPDKVIVLDSLEAYTRTITTFIKNSGTPQSPINQAFPDSIEVMGHYLILKGYLTQLNSKAPSNP